MRRFIVLVLALPAVALLQADSPDWWPEALQPSDALAHRAVTQQEAFAALRAAADTLDARCALLGGSGEEVGAAMAWENQSWHDQILTLGQLKSLAFPVHQRLQAIGLSDGALPWSADPDDDAAGAAAVFGQLQRAFAVAVPQVTPPRVQLAGDPKGVAGQSFELPVITGGGSFPVVHAVLESGPDWAEVVADGVGGWRLRGLPERAGEYPINIMVRDDRGIASLATFTLVVEPGAADSWSGVHAGFYAGRAFTLQSSYGGGETLLPGEVSRRPLIVYVRGIHGEVWPGAPVTFIAEPGSGGFARCLNRREVESSEAVLTVEASASGSTTAPFVAWVAPDTPGEFLVHAVAGEQRVPFRFRVVEEEPPLPPLTFSHHDNDDGTITFSWSGPPADSETFSISLEMAPGDFRVVYSIPVDQLPAPDSATGRYALTLHRSELNLPESQP